MPTTRHQIQLTPDEVDGGWVAECVDLPGCFSQGESRAEAAANLIDAIGGVEHELAAIDRRLAEGWVPDARPMDSAVADLRQHFA